MRFLPAPGDWNLALVVENAAYVDRETALKAGLSVVGVDRRGLVTDVATELETVRGRARVKERRDSIVSELSEG